MLVFLVSLFHAIEPFAESNLYIFNLVYVFHMPLFVLISGYFAKNISLKKLRTSSISLFETYLFLCVIILAVGSSSGSEFLFPSYSNWFILSLISWRIAAYIIQETNRRVQLNGGGYFLKQQTWLPVSIVVAFISFAFLPRGVFLSSQRTLQFLPFFLMGIYLQPCHISKIRNKKTILILLTFIGIIVLSLLDQDNLRWICYCYKNVNEINAITDASIVELFSIKAVAMAVGCCICFCCLCLDKVNERLAFYGRYTLFLYVFQMIMIHIPARLGLFNNIYVAIVSSLVLFGIGVLLSPTKIAAFVTNPISSLYKLIKEK